MATFNDRMRNARGNRSHETVAFAVREYLDPAQWVSTSTLRRIENGPEEKADPVFLWALAQVYEVELSNLSQRAADWLARRFAPAGTASDQGERNLPWNYRGAGRATRRFERVAAQLVPAFV